MPKKPNVSILLDQNIPIALLEWLQKRLATRNVYHVNHLKLQGNTDEVLYRWAQNKRAIIITYDEDFADARLYPLGSHYGVIRLRVWPTTIEKTKNALKRLFDRVSIEECKNSLIIVDNAKIRHRKLG